MQTSHFNQSAGFEPTPSDAPRTGQMADPHSVARGTAEPEMGGSVSALPWVAAYTLAERQPRSDSALATDATATAGATVEGAASQSTHAAVERRLDRWLEESPLTSRADLFAYFEAAGLSAEQVRALLAEENEALAARIQPTPAWIADLEAAFAYEEPLLQLEGQSAFLGLSEPMMLWAVDRLRAQLENLPAPHNRERVAPDLLEQTLLNALAAQMGPLVERTLVLEMHVARLQGQLDGDTPGARFAAFTARLRQPKIRRALLTEYPVLARRLITRARQTADAIGEVLTRLAHDWETLVPAFFGGESPGPLVELQTGEGDTHRDGRAVAILTFADGARLVYKPRSLALDFHFQHLLDWLNRHGAQPGFRLLIVLDRADYGWVEFVHRAPCTTLEEVERFYIRQGGYLALLYTLYAGDFHFENLLAAGEHPMLIDLEALFHPTLIDYDPSRPEHLAQAAIDNSVLSVSMLPQRLQLSAHGGTVDISGMGADAVQTAPDALPTWEGEGTDEMRLRRAHMEFVTSGHRPTLADAEIDVIAQAQAVETGFRQVYELLRTNRHELLGTDGLLARFAPVQVRVVARATRIYSLLLQETSHPSLLQHAAECDALYARLWLDGARKPHLLRLIAAEVRDLHNGDVPIFHAQPGTRHLWDSRDQRIADLLPKSGLELVEARLAALDDVDLARQLWYIRASFAAVSREDGHRIHASAQAPAEARQVEARQVEAPVDEHSPDEHSPDEHSVDAILLATASAIGDRLETIAHRQGEHAVWIGLGLSGASWSLNPLTMHLYDGHAGVALFLAYLGRATQNPRYIRLAQAALSTLEVQMAEHRKNFFYPGAFNGWGGVIYTLAHLGALWDAPHLWQQADELATLAASRLDQDHNFDIIAGAAGYIGAIEALWQCTRAPHLLDAMDRAAAHLAHHAQPQAQGVGWVVPNMGGKPLAGFSHGAAGIAWALAIAARRTGNLAYGQMAQAGLDYERSLFDEHSHNWRDLRTAPPGDSGDTTAADPGQQQAEPHEHTDFMHAWCHGAPGIGLGRLAFVNQIDRDFLAQEPFAAEIRHALQGTLAGGLGGGHSLCHGDLGNLDLFVGASLVLDRPDYLAWARQTALAIVEEQPQSGWLCGVPNGVETPGLMTGIAGMGYQLLRLCDPHSVPSVLMLEPPRATD